jgi:LmbE family N-acetylglucosaminyl deacetylase
VKTGPVLVLAPHTDDGEFGAGGTIGRWAREGREVHYVAFSACQTSIPDGWPEDILRREVAEATQILGIPSSQLRVLDFEVRRFAQARQEILQAMVDLNAELHPQLVLMPSEADLHQDHHTVALEGLRAFKTSSILAYEIPWNHLQFRSECFVPLEVEDVERKLTAVGCYKSQSQRTYTDPDYLRSHLRFRGISVGVTYAEAFDVVRWIL